MATLLEQATRSAQARAMRFDAPVQKRGSWTARMSGSGADSQPLVIEGKGDSEEAALLALIDKAPIPTNTQVRHCPSCTCEV